jgi:hypothetical protein
MVSKKSIREFDDCKTASKIRFGATLLSPRLPGVAGRRTANPRKAVSWTFRTLLKEASAKLL